MASWLTQLVNQHDELEAPLSFWRWSALAAISAVTKDQIWMDKQIYNLYPNIYVMLHADSGMKKGPPVSMARKLVQLAGNTRIITGRSSIQGILKELGSGQTSPGGKIQMKSVAFICSSELTSSIIEDKVATKILTDLYDRQYNEGEWKSLLKMESFQLKDPTITMLTASNDAMSEDFFMKSAIQGGFFARTNIIYEKTANTDNSLIYPLRDKPDYKQAAEYLKEITKLSGPFHPLAVTSYDDEYRFERRKHGRLVYFNATGALYDDWYLDFRKTIRDQEVKDDTGTLNRFGDAVLKIAMLISLSEGLNKEISPEQMQLAIDECEKLVGNVRQTTMGKSGISGSSAFKQLVIMELYHRPNHQVTRTVLLKKYWMHYSTLEEFDDMMLSFDHSGLIKSSSIGNNIIYQMPEAQVDEMNKFMSGKNK